MDKIKMSSDLKPCPFCGGEDIRFTEHRGAGTVVGHRGENVWSMCCYRCGATFPNMYEEHGKNLMIKKWNARATAQHPAVEALKSAEEWESDLQKMHDKFWREDADQEDCIENFRKSRIDFIRAIQQNALTSQTPAETSEKP